MCSLRHSLLASLLSRPCCNSDPEPEPDPDQCLLCSVLKQLVTLLVDERSFELRREGDGGSHFILVNNKNSAGAGTGLKYIPDSLGTSKSRLLGNSSSNGP